MIVFYRLITLRILVLLLRACFGLRVLTIRRATSMPSVVSSAGHWPQHVPGTTLRQVA